MSIAREAWPFAAPVLLAAGVALALRLPKTGLVLALAGLLLLAFFRIPDRRFTGPANTVIAPANGVVTRIDQVEPAEIGPGRMHRIVTFLSVFNVHAQRAPVSGEVVASRFREGRKVAAFRDDAGDLNQSHLTVLRRPNGDQVGVRQIAGLLARRVVGYLETSDSVERGELIGLIKFGSRVDLYLPEEYRVEVTKGQKLVEGLTVVATAPATESTGLDSQQIPNGEGP